MRSEYEQNQAEKLKQLFDEVNNQSLKEEESNEQKNEEQQYIEIDVLKLPPRKEVHTNPKSRLYIPSKRPLIRISFVIILLIAILATIYFFIGDQLFLFF